MRPRRTAPRVVDGKVQRKNRAALSPHYDHHDQERPVIDRQRPGAGYRHVLRKEDVERFLRMLPDWGELSKGLNAVVLAPGDPDCLGWHRPGVVAVCAWDRELESAWPKDFVDDHADVLERLGVEREPRRGGDVFVRWTEPAVRGFQLAHVLLHELGHHHDRMSTASRVRASRGEAYAERYALEYAERIWERYFDVFGW